MPTSIEWAQNRDGSQGESWNPIRARRKSDGKRGHYCQKISPGCAHCYAEAMNIWRGNGVEYTIPGLDEVELYLDEEVLTQPLRWRKPRNVFVCSMTDLFADFVPDEWSDKIYAVEALTQQHTYMHLTKRPWRRLTYLQSRAKSATFWKNAAPAGWTLEDFQGIKMVPFPLPHVREGVTVCNQKEADELIPALLATPARCRFISAEPLLGPIQLSVVSDQGSDAKRDCLDGQSFDWVICGGESGPEARPMHPEWARSLRDQCAAAGVPFFFKQWGDYPKGRECGDGFVEAGWMPVSKGGSLLDGVEHKVFPRPSDKDLSLGILFPEAR